MCSGHIQLRQRVISASLRGLLVSDGSETYDKVKELAKAPGRIPRSSREGITYELWPSIQSFRILPVLTTVYPLVPGSLYQINSFVPNSLSELYCVYILSEVEYHFLIDWSCNILSLLLIAVESTDCRFFCELPGLELKG